MIRILVTIALLATPLTAEALETRYFSFNIQPGREKLLRPVISAADQQIERMAAGMGLPIPADPIIVDVADGFDEFMAYQDAMGAQVEWAVGIAFPASGRMVLRLDRDNFFTLEETFLHELNHLLLLSGMEARYFPKWFSEGLAIFFSGEGAWKRLDVAFKAAAVDTLLPLKAMTFSFPEAGRDLHLAYAQSGLFVRYLINEYGIDDLRRLITTVKGQGAFFKHFSEIYGVLVETAFDRWRQVFMSKGGGSILSFFIDDMFIWFLITVIFVIGYVKIIRQRRQGLARMEEEERLQGAVNPTTRDTSQYGFGPLDHDDPD